MRPTYLLAGAVVVVGGLVGLRWLDRTAAADAAASNQHLREQGVTVCEFSEPLRETTDAKRMALLGAGAVAWRLRRWRVAAGLLVLGMGAFGLARSAELHDAVRAGLLCLT